MPLYINALPLELGGVGIGSYTRDLILGLGRSGVADRVVLLCPPWLAGHPTAVASGLKIQEIPVPRWLPKALRHLFYSERLGWWLRKQTDCSFFSPALHASFFTPRNSWVTCHDCMPMHFPVYLGRNPLNKWRYYRSLRFLKRCRGVITDSESSREDIVRLLGVTAERVNVVSCWVSENFSVERGTALCEGVRKKYGLPEHYWLYLGGYDIRKNVELLIRAYASVHRRQPLPKLVLAGKIPTRVHPTLCDTRGALLVAGLSEEEVLSPGFIADEDLPGLYAGAGLFIYPSRGEGFGLPPLEAMSCGCPTIVGDNTSLREVVADPEYRFATEENGELEALLSRAASAPLPLNPAPREFSVEKSLNQLLRVLGMKTTEVERR